LDYSCNEFWFTYPAKDDAIFWPLPLTIKSNLPSNVYGSAEVIETPVKNVFSIAILLDYTIGGVFTKIYDSNALPQIKLGFSGQITNKNGDPLDGGLVAHLTKINCDYANFLGINTMENALVNQLSSITDQNQLITIRFQIGISFISLSKLIISRSVEISRWMEWMSTASHKHAHLFNLRSTNKLFQLRFHSR
jgi:hypothetical protein